MKASLVLATTLLVSATPASSADDESGTAVKQLEPVTLPGLVSPVRVRRDEHNIPHIFALNDNDAVLALGYLHAQDRFFQMDQLRRSFGGTLAELLGPGAIPQDVQIRTLGLRRAAEETQQILSPEVSNALAAYAAGVNAYLETAELPPEYEALELTREGVPRWTPLDTITLAGGLAFSLSFDLSDLRYTEVVMEMIAAGQAGGFDGAALFAEDLYRSAPFDPTVSIPPPAASGATASPAAGRRLFASSAPGDSPRHLNRSTLRLIRSVYSRAAAAPLLANALVADERERGSNWWVVAGEHTDSGSPLLANDPHLGLDSPAIFYEVQLRVRSNGSGPLNVIGVGFPGTPGVTLGCNPWICWGATVNPMDVTDVYQEQLVIDPGLGLPTHTRFEDQIEPLKVINESYRVNRIGDGVDDSLEDAGVGPLDGGLVAIVPRRNNGPIIAIDFSDPLAPTALSVQYTGFSASRNLEAFRGFARARSLDDFVDALQSFDVGSQNWGYADVDGNIAYFTSAEMPIREDLQLLGGPDGGVPPFLIRDGTHTLRHEWMQITNPQRDQSLGFEILPFAEMPQVINPEAGYILNANNDPVGVTLDNNPFSGQRPGGGVFYLNPGYATGLRAGRIARRLPAALAGGATIDGNVMASIQADNRLLDAEVLVPHLLSAFANTYPAGSNPPAPLAEAINRLAAWDFSTPTGIAAGYDPGDDPEALAEPTAAEIDASVAATLYSVWRGQAVGGIIDDTLARIGLGHLAPGSMLAMSALRHHLDSFAERQGIGASGVDFFDTAAFPSPAAARDAKLLGALERALELLASDSFASAFGGSSELADYRWGYLHRVTLDHPLGGPFNLPPGGDLTDLTPELPGLARAGGFGAVDASSHSARAAGFQSFRFGSGPARRFIGRLDPGGPTAEQVIPGGVSGLPGDPFQADQLRLWLTNRYHPLHRTPAEVVAASRSFQKFVPAE